MINSRRKIDLVDRAYDMVLKWEARCFAIGLPLIITSTLRDQECQDMLYEQGRTKPGKIVTWTRNSRHLPDPVEGKSRAWDFALLLDGKPCWDVIKVDVNENQVLDYEEAAQVARDLGLLVGADFKDKDYCHIELKKEK